MNAELPRILLVEDSPTDAELTIRAFERRKLANQVELVTDGEQALQYLRQQGEYADVERPDLVLLDLNLPRVDGRQVLEELRNDADPALARMPVVVMTSSDDEQDVLRSYELRCNAYVTKPVDLAAFDRVVASIDDFWLAIVRYPRGS